MSHIITIAVLVLWQMEKNLGNIMTGLATIAIVSIASYGTKKWCEKIQQAK